MFSSCRYRVKFFWAYQLAILCPFISSVTATTTTIQQRLVTLFFLFFCSLKKMMALLMFLKCIHLFNERFISGSIICFESVACDCYWLILNIKTGAASYWIICDTLMKLLFWICDGLTLKLYFATFLCFFDYA